mmetsp:Transcript_8554/g.24818  ORF Transcript_8554/g.24818 Transcript_8554/m.24818 type:complete len:250 (+) Transcript_8554:1829-2578(+)
MPHMILVDEGNRWAGAVVVREGGGDGGALVCRLVHDRVLRLSQLWRVLAGHGVRHSIGGGAVLCLGGQHGQHLLGGEVTRSRIGGDGRRLIVTVDQAAKHALLTQRAAGVAIRIRRGDRVAGLRRRRDEGGRDARAERHVDEQLGVVVRTTVLGRELPVPPDRHRLVACDHPLGVRWRIRSVGPCSVGRLTVHWPRHLPDMKYGFTRQLVVPHDIEEAPEPGVGELVPVERGAIAKAGLAFRSLLVLFD